MPKAKQVTAKSQLREFKKTARALECDESESTFDKALNRIGRAKPPTTKLHPVKRDEKKR